MKIPYSLGDITPILQAVPPGGVPFQDGKILLQLATELEAPFPNQIAQIADLFVVENPTLRQFGVIAIAHHVTGWTPPTNESAKVGGWNDVPNSPIYGQVRLTFSEDALREIRKVGGQEYQYELTLTGIEFVEQSNAAGE